jgi:Peptidase family M23
MPMFTPFLACLAVLVILIYALYGRADNKAWFYEFLGAIFCVWLTVMAYDGFFDAPDRSVNTNLDAQSATMSHASKRGLMPRTVPDIDPATINQPPTCINCGSKGAAPAFPIKPNPVATNFMWPVKGKVIAKFEKGRNPGINIQVKNGADIRAAGAGNVIYANENETDWGRVVMIQHANGFVSVYANNSAVTVKKGDVIKQGAMIAKAGMLAGQSTPQLQFRLRRNDAEVDPSLYLREDVASIPQQ